jgi:Domain of unknown function (DUF4169)
LLCLVVLRRDRAQKYAAFACETALPDFLGATRNFPDANSIDRNHAQEFARGQYFRAVPAVWVAGMVMGETVNLKLFRKRAERDRAARQAETNRARFGRTRSERARDVEREKGAGKHLDQHRLEGEDAS